MSEAAPVTWREDQRCARTALVIACVQLALGLFAGLLHELGGYGVEGDFYAGYAPMAKSLARGEWAELPRSGPGYPALLALCSFAIDDLFVVAKLVAAVSVAVTGWLAYLTIRSFVDARAGLFVQVLLYVSLFRYSFTAGNDLFFVALSSASLCFLLKRARPRALELAIAGVFAGLATITRYPGATLVPAALIGLLLLHPARASWRVRWRDAGLYCAGALVASSPWWLANLVRYGEPFHNQSHALIALEVYGDPAQRLSSGALGEMETRFPSLAAVIAENPVRFVRNLAFDAFEHANQMFADLAVLPASLFIGAGAILLFLRGRSDRRRVASFMLYALFGFACVAVVPYQERYYYTILPALFLPLACALLDPTGDARERERSDRSLRALRALATTAVVAMFVVFSALKTHKYLSSEPVEVFSAARALREQPEAGLLVARKPHLGYLSERAHVLPGPAPDLARFEGWLRNESGARYVYVGSAEVEGAPALAPLARGVADVPWLHLLDRVESPPACLYRID